MTTFLMNPVTGSIDTRENWLAEMPNWETSNGKTPEDQFNSLIEVDDPELRIYKHAGKGVGGVDLWSYNDDPDCLKYDDYDLCRYYARIERLKRHYATA